MSDDIIITSEKKAKVLFVMDDRLPQDRKKLLQRNLTLMKTRFGIEFMAPNCSEEEVLARIHEYSYELILLPWYKYLAWKRIESYFGTLRMQGPTVSGYFADAVLPFELSQIPNYHRLVLLDFYRTERNDLEQFFESILSADRRTGFGPILDRVSTLYFSQWYLSDQGPLRGLSHTLKCPHLQMNTLGGRTASVHLFVFSLWMLCFKERQSLPKDGKIGEIEVVESDRTLGIKLTFETGELTLKRLIDQIWPDTQNPNVILSELKRHCDFLKVFCYPEGQKVEITGWFYPSAPSQNYPNEVRGFWIEPLKKNLESTPDQFPHIKRIELGSIDDPFANPKRSA